MFLDNVFRIFLYCLCEALKASFFSQHRTNKSKPVLLNPVYQYEIRPFAFNYMKSVFSNSVYNKPASLRIAFSFISGLFQMASNNILAASTACGLSVYKLGISELEDKHRFTSLLLKIVNPILIGEVADLISKRGFFLKV